MPTNDEKSRAMTTVTLTTEQLTEMLAETWGAATRFTQQAGVWAATNESNVNAYAVEVVNRLFEQQQVCEPCSKGYHSRCSDVRCGCYIAGQVGPFPPA